MRKAIIKKVRGLRFFLEYAGVMIFYCSIRILPLNAIRTISNISGRFLYLLPGFRKLCCANIRTAFPEKPDCEIRRIAMESLQNMVQTILELFWFSGRQDVLANLTEDSHICVNLTKKSMKEGGLIWISPHIGNWELAAFK